MIRLELWEIINAAEPKPRDDLPESLEAPETPVGDKATAEDAKGNGNGSEADPSERRD